MRETNYVKMRNNMGCKLIYSFINIIYLCIDGIHRWVILGSNLKMLVIMEFPPKTPR